MVYERPCRFPIDDLDRLWIVVAGRKLSYAEALRWRRVLSGNRKWWPILSFAMMFFFIVSAIAALSDPSRNVFGMGGADVAVAIVILLSAAAGASVVFGRTLWKAREQSFSRLNMYHADVARHSQGTRIAFYGDRLTVTSLRGTTILYFADVQACVETVDGFALSNGADWIILRAQDLIAFDANLIRSYLEERLERRVMRVLSRVKPQLQQPLMIPSLSEKKSLATAALTYEKTTLYAQYRTDSFRAFVTVALLLAVMAGVVIAAFVSVTPWLLADVGIFCGSALAVTWLIALCLFAWHRPKKSADPLMIRFFEDGLSITADGASQFCIKERLRLSADNTGVTIHFLNGKKLFIPFDLVDNAVILQSMAGVSHTIGQ